MTGKPVGEFRHDSPPQSVLFSPDGKRIVTVSDNGVGRLWTVFPDTQQLVAHARAIVPRCLTPAQRAAYFLPPEPRAWCIETAKWPYHTAGMEGVAQGHARRQEPAAAGDGIAWHADRPAVYAGAAGWLAGWDCQLHPLTIELRDNAAWVRRRILQPEDPEIVKVDRREHRREIRVEKGQAA